MGLPFKTLDDVDYSGKRVLVRVDINCSIDPNTKKILDYSRIKSIVPTLKTLSKSKVVLMAHQGRPGGDDFVSLKEHAEILVKLGFKAKFVDDIFGEKAQHAIKNISTGDILVLENVRFHDGENKTGPPEEMAKDPLVQNLYPLFDLFVNDAFGAAHRGQPSIVGFTAVLPSVAGRVVEKEVRVLSEVTAADKRPWTLVLGGSKVSDKIKTLGTLLETGRVDHALIGGLIGNVFLAANGLISESYGRIVPEFSKVLPEAKALLQKYADVIRIPVDVAVERNGTRVECSLDEAGGDPILDIGPETLKIFQSILKESAVVFANGPLGLCEKEQFKKGTVSVLDTLAHSKCITVVGGGHVGAMAEELGLSSKIAHISTGGGATISFLTGKKLDLLSALESAAKRMDRQSSL